MIQIRGKQPLRFRPRFFHLAHGTVWDQRNSLRGLHFLQEKLRLSTGSAGTGSATPLRPNYFRQGGDIVRFSMVLGHSQITTTERYLHLLTEDLSASHQKVSILNRLGVNPTVIQATPTGWWLD